MLFVLRFTRIVILSYKNKDLNEDRNGRACTLNHWRVFDLAKMEKGTGNLCVNIDKSDKILSRNTPILRHGIQQPSAKFPYSFIHKWMEPKEMNGLINWRFEDVHSSFYLLRSSYFISMLFSMFMNNPQISFTLFENTHLFRATPVHNLSWPLINDSKI